jgi:hypothetical protein
MITEPSPWWGTGDNSPNDDPFDFDAYSAFTSTCSPLNIPLTIKQMLAHPTKMTG